MKLVKAKVIMLAETQLLPEARSQLYAHFGVAYSLNNVETNDGEELIELAGRLCYRSFAPGLNPNVTKIREGNKEYIANLLRQQHGSVLEHATVTFAFMGVSRVLTHELVRHRVGIAFSQESMRFVRLENIPMYWPEGIQPIGADGKLDEEANKRVLSIFGHVVATCENAIAELTKLFSLDDPRTPFTIKKAITSALRRLAPGGHTTNIIVTANHRTWRHIIEQRTSEGAEEEIRGVIKEVARQLLIRYPHIYQDMVTQSNGSLSFLNPGEF